MAIIAATIEKLETFGDNAHVHVWLLANGDAGVAVEMPGSSDRSIHFSGTPGVGGTIIMQGSNHAAPASGSDADWFPLTDPQGNAISKTAASTGEAILELTRWIRPKCTAGDGTTAWQARLLVKR